MRITKGCRNAASSQGLESGNLFADSLGKRLSKPVEPLAALIALVAHQIKTAGKADLVGQHLAQHAMGRQREIMRHTKRRTLRRQFDLNRNGIRRQRHPFNAKVAQVVQLLIKDHIRYIANHLVTLQVFQLFDWRVFAQVMM